MSMLRLDDVTLKRGQHEVLANATVAFGVGRLTAVIGPNGAGKSSLLEAAAGLLAVSAGTVRLGGDDLGALSRRTLARRRAYLPQNPRVEWAISVEQVVALGLTAELPAFGDLPPGAQVRIDDALARFDLTALRDRSATRLSGGELARVMLARATVGQPEVLIVDEPTAGLDPRHVRDAGRHLRALADGGCAVIVALHDLDLAARIADDVVAVKAGAIRAQGPAAAILTDALLTELYDVPARVRRDADGVTIHFPH